MEIIMIVPPTKLRVDYTIHGMDTSKTVHIDHMLEVNNKVK